MPLRPNLIQKRKPDAEKLRALLYSEDVTKFLDDAESNIKSGTPLDWDVVSKVAYLEYYRTYFEKDGAKESQEVKAEEWIKRAFNHESSSFGSDREIRRRPGDDEALFRSHRYPREVVEESNPGATLGIPAPALGYCENCHIFLGSPDHILIGSVPLEEYVFYFTGFIFVLLFYIWLDEFWLSAYSVRADARERTDFRRLLQFHPASLLVGLLFIATAILYRHFYNLHYPQEPAGFPGYFLFLTVGALGPAAIIFPAALPVINWRAFSPVLFVTLLTSLLWEATLGVPYGWWDYQHSQMMGVFVTAWNMLPVEAVSVWVAVSFETVIVYEVVKRWQASGKGIRHALFGPSPKQGSLAAPR